MGLGKPMGNGCLRIAADYFQEHIINMESMKTKQTRIKYIFLFLILLPFILNVFWSGTGPGWLYWSARFLGHIEEFLAGILLILFPMALQKIFGTKADRRVAILLILLGFYFLVIGFDGLSLLTRRWSEECMNITACLK
jgi:hypothetical protein